MLLLSIIPSIILFSIVWKNDTVEKEPPALLWKLFFCGALTIITAVAIGLFGEGFLSEAVPDQTSMLYLFIDNFILTALVEEGGKYFVLKKVTWKNKEFNYTFDAVVYSVVVSLGFATFENILYVFQNGIGTAITRAIFSVPGHVIDAIFMGYFYGLARRAHGAGEEGAAKRYLFEALLIPVIMHGFYDFCLSTEDGMFILLFLVYEVVITVVAVKKLKSLSKNDAIIPGMEETVVQAENTAVQPENATAQMESVDDVQSEEGGNKE